MPVFPVKKLLADAYQQHQDLFLGPPQDIAERPNAEAVETVECIGKHEAANLLEVRILGPRIVRNLELSMRHVDEARILDPSLELGAGAGFPLDLLAGLDK